MNETNHIKNYTNPVILDLTDFLQELRRIKPKYSRIYKGKQIRYLHLHCGFDIETTTQNEKAFMYIWQFSLKYNGTQYVVTGRHWYEFTQLLKSLTIRFGLREEVRIIIWVANLSYEFQFMRKYLKIDELFAKTSRNPLYVRCGGIEFRDCLAISQGNLDYLAKTYTTSQKMVGDLDYTILRNSQTSLNETELQYCINDVIILSEFSEKIFADYIIPQRYIPLTSTGILRHDLKQAVKNSGEFEHTTEWIKSLYPQTKADYLYIMQYLFRGGYVHSNYSMTGTILYNMDSYDLKSSYPSSAFRGYFPMTPFKATPCDNMEDYERLCSNYCTIAILTFHNIDSKTAHSIESKSKCIKLVNPLIDNGRIRKADSMTVFLTELDYQTYKDFYTWQNVTIHTVEISQKGNLPRYLLDRFYYWFHVKQSIDSHENPQEYAISKTRINGHYGLCVTRLCFNDIVYNNGNWEMEENKQTYDQMITNQVLSPFWGVYITAHSRRTELTLLYKMHEETVYCDTDSLKLFETENVLFHVKQYNEMIVSQNKKICDLYGYDFNVLGNIGILEKETADNEKGKILKFKTLGAKRYLSDYANKGFESTVSGLGKKALANYCNENNMDAFYIFDNGLSIPSEYTNKLTPIYIDEPTTETIVDVNGNFETMKEMSSIYLKPVTFSLSMEKEYLNLLEYHLERVMRYGK